MENGGVGGPGAGGSRGPAGAGAAPPRGSPSYARLASLLKGCVDDALASELAERGAAVIPYRDEGSGDEPRPVPDVGRYRDLLAVEPGAGVEERLLAAWRRRCGAGRRRWWGVLIGRPSGYLVMIDLDDDELGELWRRDRAGWRRRVEELAADIRRAIPGACVVASRRGVHALFRVPGADWEAAGKGQLHGSAVVGGREYRVDVVLSGATPLRSRKHAVLECPGLPVIGLREALDAVGFQGAAGGGAAGPREVDAAGAAPGRGLGESQLSAAVELLKGFWVEGHRHRLALGIAGLLAKTGYSEESAAELVRRLAEAAGDEEAGDRLRAVSDTYRRLAAGEEVAGKSILVDELEAVTGDRDEALLVVEQLESIIGARAPSRIVMLKVDDSGRTKTYIANDPLRGIVEVRVRDGEIARRRLVTPWYVRDAEVASVDGVHYVSVTVEAPGVGRERLRGTLDEAARAFSGLVGGVSPQRLRDAFSLIVYEMLRRGVARRGELAPAPGLLGDWRLRLRGVYAELLVPGEPDAGAAREALRLLLKMRAMYRDHSKFDAAMLWAGYAVASYAAKESLGVKQVYLLLHGERQTGKTTLARIVAAMFPLRTVLGEVPEEGQTEYRLAWKLSIAATPVIEDEVQGIGSRRGLLGLLKRAATGLAVRWRGDSGRVFHARAPLIMTSNYREVLADDALRERVLAVEFTAADRPGRGDVPRFRELRARYAAAAPHLGALLLRAAEAHAGELKRVYMSVQEPVDALAAGKAVWRLVADKLGAGEPPWLGLDPGAFADPEPEMPERDIVLAALKDVLMEALRADRQAVADLEAAESARDVLTRYAALLPSWVRPSRSGLLVGAPLLQELRRRYGYEPIGGLKGLARRLGWAYTAHGSARRKVMVVPWGVVEELFPGGPEDV